MRSSEKYTWAVKSSRAQNVAYMTKKKTEETNERKEKEKQGEYFV